MVGDEQVGEPIAYVVEQRGGVVDGLCMDDGRAPLDELIALAEAGHTDQLLLGGDTTTAAAWAATGGGPGMQFLL